MVNAVESYCLVVNTVVLKYAIMAIAHLVKKMFTKCAIVVLKREICLVVLLQANSTLVVRFVTRS